VLDTIDAATQAIDRIRGQGEGTATDAKFGDKLAHYYAFGEIYHGRELVESPPGKFTFSGAEVPYPKVLTMARVPYGGWPDRNPDGLGTLEKFNGLYAHVLQKLEKAWGSGGAPSLNESIVTMTQMEAPAKTLMHVPRAGCGDHYGPDFVI
jgi:hypothetical protein